MSDRRPRGALLDALVDDVAQRVHAHVRGVDHQVRGRCDRLEQLALERHRLAQVDVAARHRVLAAGLGEAPQQLLVVGDQEQRPRTACRCGAARRPAAERSRSRPGCCARRGRWRCGRRSSPGRAPCGDEGLEQRRRDIVDAIEVDVLEHVQSHALAGAGQPADDDDAHALMVNQPPGTLQAPLTRGLSAAFRYAAGASAAWWSARFFLVLLDAAVELVGEHVDGGVHVRRRWRPHGWRCRSA